MRRIILLLTLNCIINLLCLSQSYEDGVDTDPLNITITDQINTTFFELRFDSISEYIRVSFKDCRFIDSIGHPELPYYSLQYIIPFNKQVISININSTSQQLSGQYLIYPAQPPIKIGDTTTIEFVEPDLDIYALNSPYNSEIVKVVRHVYNKSYHIVTINVYPLVYIPATQKLTLHSNISFSLNLEVKEELPVRPKIQSDLMYNIVKEGIKATVKNEAQFALMGGGAKSVVSNNTMVNNIDNILGAQIPTVTDYIIPAYIIITNNIDVDGNEIPSYSNKNMVETFQELADCKTRKGIPTIITTLDEINTNYYGCDLQEKIHYYLKNIYEQWGTMFVLFGGDVNVVPARMINYGLDIFPSDFYYTAIEKTWDNNNDGLYGNSNTDFDLTSEFYVGRAPIKTCEEANVFINKIFEYENLASVDKNYINNLLFLVADTHEGIPIIDEYHSFIDSIIPDYLFKYKLYDHFETNNADNSLNRINFIRGINGEINNTMFHLVYHCDHSSPYAMGASSRLLHEHIINNDVAAFSNENYHQILFTLGCEPAPFNKNTIIEEYINNPNGGGVAAFASTADSQVKEVTTYALNFYDLTYSSTICNYSLGCIMDIAKASLSDAYYFIKNHLFGDPEMSIWTNTPKEFTVNISNTNPSNTNKNIVITVSNLVYDANITVCLQKENDIYLTQTKYCTNFSEVFSFEINPETAGNMFVTITGHNYLPYTITLPVSISGRNLIINNIEIDDFSGNNNNQLNAGETVNFSIALKNNGTLSTNNVCVTLSCVSIDTSLNINNIVTITEEYSCYGNIPVNNIAGNSSVFQIQINNNIPSETIVKFILNMTGNDNFTQNRSFVYNISSPEISKAFQYIIPETPVINDTINVHIELRNDNDFSVNGVTAIFTSSSSIINIINPTVYYGNFNSFEYKENVQPFRFTSNSSPNQVLSQTFSLNIEDELGNKCVYEFNLSPTNSDLRLFYTSTQNSVTLIWGSQGNNCKYLIYRSDSIDGEKVRLTDYPIIGTRRYTDNGLNPNTIYHYWIVCLNANDNSESKQHIETKTNFLLHEGWPISTSILFGSRTDGSPNIYDIDNDGLKEIFFTQGDISRRIGGILAFTHDGEELFDIDNNPETISGFSNDSVYYQASTAIGDINNDGIIEIIVPSTNYSSNTTNNRKTLAYSTIDGENNGKPDLKWKIWTGHTFVNAVLAPFKNSNSLETLVVDSWIGYEKTFRIINNDGSYFYEHRVDSTKLFQGNLNAPAVADIDNDGHLEIVIGYNSGLYVFEKNPLTNYSTYKERWHYSDNAYPNMQMPVILADLDGDNNMEIIFVSYQNSPSLQKQCIVKVNRYDGTSVEGWGTTSHTFNLEIDLNNKLAALPPFLSIGDLNNDGYPDVIIATSNGTHNKLYAWKNTGEIFPNFPIVTTSVIGENYMQQRSPLIADIDGDDEVEIILASANGGIYAYKVDGSSVPGFPLASGIVHTPCIADIDGDGKNEIIAAGEQMLYVWDTDGDSRRIEWGHIRADERNTGAYKPKTCEFTNDTIYISSDQTWNTNKRIENPVVIDSTCILTITTRIDFSPQASIIVKPGAKLIIDGGKLSNACRNELWRGIEIYGDKSMVQHPDCQGQVIMRNGACIENAVVAIKVGDITAANFDGGGIVNINNSTFRNNLYSLIMEDYRYVHNGGVCTNTSYVIDTHFYIDDYMFENPYTFVSHIRLCEVEGVRFAGCNFEYLKSDGYTGRAIYSLSAGFKVLEVCRLPPNQGCECNGVLTRSTFQGFNCAIEYGEHSSTAANIVIDNCEFRNNIRGIKASAINNMQITKSTFSFTNPLSSNLWYGIHLSNCSGYLIEENQFNTFTDGKSNYITTGMYINNSGTDENIIYRNDFKNLTYGIYVSGINGTTVDNNIAKIKGLQFNCNYFENNKYDIYIDNTGIVRSSQGDKTKGADNIFSNTTDYNIYCGNLLTSIQYYHYDNTVLEPVSISSNVTLYISKNENDCESTLCDSVYIIIDDPIKKYNNINNDYISMQNTFIEEGYDKILKEYFSSGYFEDETLLEQALFLYNKISEFSIEMSNLSNINISFVKNDSIVEFIDLNPWYSIVQEPLQKYLLAETHILEKEYGKAKEIIKNIPKTFDLSEVELYENQNYISYYNFREGIRKQEKSLAQLDEKEIIALEKIALEMDGLASAMARNILCFFYDICIEIEMPMEKSTPVIEDQQLIINNVGNNLNKIHVYPNPGEDYITIISEIKDYNFELFNISGSKQISVKLQKGSNIINTSPLKQGIYIYKVVMENEVISGKWVKN